MLAMLQMCIRDRVYALDRNKADIEGLSAFVETDLSDKGSIDAAFGVLPQVIYRFFGVAGLSGACLLYTSGLNSVFFQPQCIVLVFCITQSMTKAVAWRVRSIDIGAVSYTHLINNDATELHRARNIKKAGFNAIRSAHHPMSRSLMKACDEVGPLPCR